MYPYDFCRDKIIFPKGPQKLLMKKSKTQLHNLTDLTSRIKCFNFVRMGSLSFQSLRCRGLMASALDSGSGLPSLSPGRWTLTFVPVKQDSSMLQRLSPAFRINVFLLIYCWREGGGGEGLREETLEWTSISLRGENKSSYPSRCILREPG